MMNDETEQFEARLKRQPLRQLPANWKGEILAAAKSAHPASRIPRRSFLSTINSQLSTLLWPHPKAWAGLAAVWVAIVALNISMHEPSPTAVMAKKSAPASAEVMAELKQQRLMYAQLIGASEQPADRPKTFIPLPRSERAGIMTT